MEKVGGCGLAVIGRFNYTTHNPRPTTDNLFDYAL